MFLASTNEEDANGGWAVSAVNLSKVDGISTEVAPSRSGSRVTIKSGATTIGFPVEGEVTVGEVAKALAVMTTGDIDPWRMAYRNDFVVALNGVKKVTNG